MFLYLKIYVFNIYEYKLRKIFFKILKTVLKIGRGNNTFYFIFKKIFVWMEKDGMEWKIE